MAMSTDAWDSLITVSFFVGLGIGVLSLVMRIKRKDRFICPFCRSTLNAYSTVCRKCGRSLPTR